MPDSAEAALHQEFLRIDAGTAALCRASGLSCPSDCGRCCLSPEVHTSELEVRPLAREIWRRGEAEHWLARLAAAGGDRRCVVYDPSPGDATRGRCALYPFRPPVCRLFGFATRRTREGGVELAVCREHRHEDPGAVARAVAAIAAGVAVLDLSSATAALAGLERGPGQDLLPINVALHRALGAVGLALRLAGMASTDSGGDDPRPVHPPRPAA